MSSPGSVVIKEYPRDEHGNATHIQHLLDAYMSLGQQIDVKNETEWNTMTTEDFAMYDAVIVVDNGFVPSQQHEHVENGYVYDPFSNAASWGPAVQDGNVILLGTQELQPNVDEESKVLTQYAARFSLDSGEDDGDEKQPVLTFRGNYTNTRTRTHTGAYISFGKTLEQSGSIANVTWLHDAFHANFKTIQFSKHDSLRHTRNRMTATHESLHGIEEDQFNGRGGNGQFAGARPYSTFVEWPRDTFKPFAVNKYMTEAKYVAPNEATGNPFILLQGRGVVMLGTEPSSSPSLILSSTPTMSPSTYSSHRPSITPTTSPSVLPSHSSQPTYYPSSQHSNQPSTYLSSTPSTYSTIVITSSPTHAPSVSPSFHSISSHPSSTFSSKPTMIPSSPPSSHPSISPTWVPISGPSLVPTMTHSIRPTLAKIIYPSQNPSFSPSYDPSTKPTSIPTSTHPSHVPSITPVLSPSTFPSYSPSSSSTYQPSIYRSSTPSTHPSIIPSVAPTYAPSIYTSLRPSMMPSEKVKRHPTSTPSSKSRTMTPSTSLSSHPTISVTWEPSAGSSDPTMTPSMKPTMAKSNDPSQQPTFVPNTGSSEQPTEISSSTPSSKPHRNQPTIVPTTFLTTKPSSTPTLKPSCQTYKKVSSKSNKKSRQLRRNLCHKQPSNTKKGSFILSEVFVE